MNFLSYIINKFKKKDYNIGIMRFGDNIVIPGREYFKEDKQIELLEEYKKHYLEELNKRNVVTTLNFNSNELKQEMNMNVDIILRMLMDNDDFYRLAPEELIIQSLKLKMYYEEINRLEEETILRLVALKEIEKSKKVPRRNKMALDEEINHLSVILEMYSYRKSAISIELKNYMDTLSTRELTIDDGVLKQRLDDLLQISEGIYDKKELDKYSDTKVKIAILERECERYVYLNKDRAEKLKEGLNRVIQLEYLNEKLVNTTIEVLNNKNINSLESELLLFYYYSNHLVEEEYLRKLYEFKFKFLTRDIYYLDSSPIKKSDNGFSYYKEIIEKKIEDIIKGNNEIFNNKLKKEDIKTMIKYFIDFYLDENEQIDYDDILINKLKLGLLLSFDTENGLYYFYDKTKISEYNKNFKEKYKEEGVIFDDHASLLDAIEFVSVDNPFYNSPLYKIFSFKYEHDKDFIVEDILEDRIKYFLPNHLVSLDLTKMNYELYKDFASRCTNMILICSDSLEHFTYANLFDDANIYKVVLNTKLETFRCNDYRNVTNMYYPYFNNAKSKLTFMTSVQIPNCASSRLLCNRENLKDLFSCYSLYSRDKDDENDYILEHLLKFNKLILYYDDMGVECEVTYEELLSPCFSMLYVRKDYDIVSSCAVSKLRDVIKSDCGYDIFSSKVKIKK